MHHTRNNLKKVYIKNFFKHKICNLNVQDLYNFENVCANAFLKLYKSCTFKLYILCLTLQKQYL